MAQGVLRAGGYHVLVAHDAEMAFEILACHDVDVVVADQVMPGMLGTELLNRVRKLSPDTLRILLSGDSDRGALISAINEGRIYRFVEKTETCTALRGVVDEALRRSTQMRDGGEESREVQTPRGDERTCDTGDAPRAAQTIPTAVRSATG